jgi:hypothetical protein
LNRGINLHERKGNARQERIDRTIARLFIANA